MLDYPANPTHSKEEILKIRDLSTRSLAPWLRDMALDWAVIAASLTLALKVNAWPVYLLALIIVGNRQHALGILGHEGSHFAIHKNMRLNDRLANIFCFWPVLLTVQGYRDLHFTHHKNTGTCADPELMHKKARAPQWDLPMKKRTVLSHMLKDFFFYSLPDLFIIVTFSRPKDAKALLPIGALHAAFIAASVAFHFWAAAIIWYLALATTFMMFFRLRLWIEHQGTFETNRVALNPIEAAIVAPHKIWLHWEHHEFPAVPYYNLEKARKILKGPEIISLRQLIENLCAAAPRPSGASIDSALMETTADDIGEAIKKSA